MITDLKVSIIIPIYNVTNYIESCINSVIIQDYTNIECILVDDNGKDDSIIKAKKAINNYKGNITFNIIYHPYNKGLSEARNTGIKNATGTYIYFLDSDDELMPNCISNLIIYAQKYNSADIIQGNALENSRQIKWLTSERGSNLEYYSTNHDSKSILYNINATPSTSWNKLIRTNFLKENFLYFYPGIYYEDLLWLFHASQHIKSIAYCDKFTYNYRTSPMSILRNNNEAHSRRRALSLNIIIINMFKSINKDIDSTLERNKLYATALKALLNFKESTSDIHNIKYYNKIMTIILFYNIKKKHFWDTIFIAFMLPPLKRLTYIKWFLNKIIFRLPQLIR